jgi:hypothetical protein
MAGKNVAVFGIYKSSAQAESAVEKIIEFRTVAGGFTHNDISVLLTDIKSSKEFAYEKNTKAPEGATTGVATGGVIGGTLGLLTGIGALAIPGLGPFIAAGPIMAGLACLGVGGAFGGLVGAFVGMGVPEYEAKRYEGRVKEGGVLLSVHCETSDQISRAKDLLMQTGAEDISFANETAVSSHGLKTETADSSRV